eukprot:11645760-Heterocapsa_arctica.AAC.1
MTLQAPPQSPSCTTVLSAFRERLTGKVLCPAEHVDASYVISQGSCHPGTWPLASIRGTWDGAPEDLRSQPYQRQPRPWTYGERHP